MVNFVTHFHIHLVCESVSQNLYKNLRTLSIFVSINGPSRNNLFFE